MAVSLLGPLFGAFGMEAAKGAASVADLGLEALFGDSVAGALDDAQEAMRAYTSPLPPNHDLERALRCAQLTASLILVRAHGMALEAEQAADGRDRTGQPPPFLAEARGWLRTQLGLCPALALQPNAALVAEMEAALDGMLQTGTPLATARDRTAAVAEACWAELCAGVTVAPPPEFRAVFHDAQKMAGEDEHFACLGRVADGHGAMAARVLVGTDSARKEMGKGFALGFGQRAIRQRPILHCERAPHHVHA